MKITLLKYFDRPALVGMDFNLSYADLFERAKRAEEKARERLAAAKEEQDIRLAKAKLARALIRQQVAEEK